MSWGVSFLRPMASVTGTALAVALEDVLQVRNRRFRAAVQAAQQDLAGGVQRLAEEVLELWQADGWNDGRYVGNHKLDI